MPRDYCLNPWIMAIQSINLPKITEIRISLFNAGNDFLYISHWVGVHMHGTYRKLRRNGYFDSRMV